MTFELDRPTTAKFPPAKEPQRDLAPSSTGIELAIAEASRYADMGEDEAAEIAYQRADRLLGSERSPRHAEVMVCLALLLRRRGELAQAMSYLDMALAVFPEHRAALSQRLALAREQADMSTAAALRARMLVFCESAEARMHVLNEVVDDALEAAVGALKQAIELRPADAEMRERLFSLLEATGDFEGAVNASVTLAESLTEPRARARAMSQAASLCAKKLYNVDRAVALFEAAIADDPTVPGAFEAIVGMLIKAGDVVGTERAYVRQIERLADGGHHQEEAELSRKLAGLREVQLADPSGAIVALQRATSLRPDDVSSRHALARVLERNGDIAAALRQLERVTQLAPTERTAYREIVRLARAASQFEKAFFAASALVQLGEAEEAEQALYRQFATYSAPSARQPIDEGTLSLLRLAEHPVRLLFLAIHDAAIAAKQSLLRASKFPPALDERERQQPDVSTLSAVKVVAWTSKLLGLPSYALYARPGQSFALAHPMSPSPGLILGAGMLSGRSVPELLFRAGYELGAQRELGRLPVFYSNAQELETLLAAAFAICKPQSLPAGTAELKEALDGCLDDVTRSRLQAMVSAAVEQRLSLDVRAMLRDVELLAGRIGLIACTDVTVAARQVTIESRPTVGLSAAERVRDLLSFAVSESHAQARSNLGMVIGAASKSIPA